MLVFWVVAACVAFTISNMIIFQITTRRIRRTYDASITRIERYWQERYTAWAVALWNAQHHPIEAIPPDPSLPEQDPLEKQMLVNEETVDDFYRRGNWPPYNRTSYPNYP